MAERLDANMEPLARIASRDNGKAIRETRAEIANVIRYFEYFAGMCQNVLGQTMPETGPFFTYTRREPVGVVGAIIPWNSPLVTLAWKVCPALAGGNAIVLKPAEDTPVSALVFASLIEELDLPAGVISVVPGSGAAPARPSSSTPTSTRSHSPAPPRPAGRSQRKPQRPLSS